MSMYINLDDGKQIEIVNEDGTPIDFEYPENPLKEKWDKLYPPNQRYSTGDNCEGYCCMYCGLCPKGEYWKVPEEDKEMWEKHLEDVKEYERVHNPSMYAKLYL